VHVDSAIGHYVIAPNVGAFLARYPDLALELVVRDRLGDFVGEGFDVAVRFGNLEDSALTCRLLFETRVLTCASPGYLKRRGVPVHPTALVDHECIQFRNPVTGRPFAWKLWRAAERVPVATTGRLTVNDPASLLATCLAGHGIAQPRVPLPPLGATPARQGALVHRLHRPAALSVCWAMRNHPSV